MEQIGIIEAWAAWSDGQQLSDQTLWGMSVLWWGRIGKILQAIGALTVIVEIIGAERLRSFGSSLHGALTFRGLNRQFNVAIALARDSIAYIRAPEGNEKDALNRVLDSPFAWLDGILAIIMAIGVGIFVFGRYGIILAVFSLLLTFIVGYVFVTPFLAAMIVLVVLSLGWILDVLLIEPIAWVIEKASVDWLVKLTGVALLIVGFHFDLLAS